jgi:hypothetical protein
MAAKRLTVTVEDDILVRLERPAPAGDRAAQPLLRRPVRERRHQRDQGASQEAGVVCLTRRDSRNPAPARNVQVAGERANLGAGPRRGAAPCRGTSVKLNGRSHRLRDGP